MKQQVIPRILLAGDRSSSGKTTIVAGLLSALKARGLAVQPFKVAMDYIDPSYHSWITGRQCRNLDGYLMTKGAVLEIFSHACEGADIAVIEGVRGLYEGYDGDLGSTAQIAKLLQAPVLFVVDARSITRSAAALVKGYMDYDPDVRIKGVILNRIGGRRHAEKARKEIEHYTGLQVVGVIERNESMHLAMRHLGLVPVLEGARRHEGFEGRLSQIRSIVEEGLDIGRILEMAGEAPAMDCVQEDIYRRSRTGQGIRVAVAQDEAFNFYYRENLELIELSGAEVVPFSPVHDAAIPRNIHGIYIGGGYPEFYSKELSENDSMRRSILDLQAGGMPIFAECGGLMYLSREIEWPHPASGKTQSHEMVGLVPGLSKKGRVRVVSYVNGSFVKDCAIGGAQDKFLGHEFHHSEIVMDKKDNVDYAMKMDRGTGIDSGRDGIVSGNMIACYVHLHAASYRKFPSHFIDHCKRYARDK